jgi:hypothetical protein
MFNNSLSGNKFLYFMYKVVIFFTMHYPLLMDTVKFLKYHLALALNCVQLCSPSILGCNTTVLIILVLCVYIDHILICNDNQTPISISRTGLQFEFGWKL